MDNCQDLVPVAQQFALQGRVNTIDVHGNGHIHYSYRVETTQDTYLLQQINLQVFSKPRRLLANCRRITAHLTGKGIFTPQLIRACRGGWAFLDRQQRLWRMWSFVKGACSYEVAESPVRAASAAAAFARYIAALSDLGGRRLYETIVDFHNTRFRFTELRRALVRHPEPARLQKASAAIEFFLARQGWESFIAERYKTGVLRPRITHNDTKINNVLFACATGEPLCVIDLDTTMPGTLLYDFGDLVRTCASTACEDETDLSRVWMDRELFQALAKGFISGLHGIITAAEKQLLPVAGILITLNIGLRFLTDYLCQDVYFKTQRPEHNLDRCHNQIALLKSIEAQRGAMEEIISRV